LLEPLEARHVLNYSFSAVPFQATDLSTLDPSVAWPILQYGDLVGTPVYLGTNQFNFYGTTYTGSNGLFTSPKGLITFGQANAPFLNGHLNFDPDQPAIAPLWSDWSKFSGGPLLMEDLDVAHNQLILQWDHVQHFLGNGTATFQVVLQLNTGDTPGTITFNYLNADTGDQYANGAAATVGVKDGGNPAQNFVEISYDATSPYVGSHQAIQLTWNHPNPPPAISGFGPGTPVEQGGSSILTVNGSNFLNTSIVQMNGTALPTTFINSSQLQAVIPGSATTEEGALNITVFNPGTPSFTSNIEVLPVSDAALTMQAEAISGTEGQGLSNVLVATFTDPGSDGTTNDYSSTVTWLDANGQPHSSAGTIVSAGTNSFDIYASNALPYPRQGSYIYKISLNDAGLSNALADGRVNVFDVPLTATGTTLSGTEGVAFTGVVGTFSDGNPAATAGTFQATITWSDGSTSTGTIAPANGGGFQVTGTHTFAEEGAYTASLSISDQGGSSAQAASSITVADAALTATGTTLSATEGVAYTGVVGTFSDGNPAASAGTFQATITWGDGSTSSGTINAASSGGFQVAGMHTYAAEGLYTFSVSIDDQGGSKALASGPATVAGPLTATGATLATTEGAVLKGVVATFTDTNSHVTAGDFKATIYWGDGSASTGIITRRGGGFQVTGTHTYAEEGVYAASVSIRGQRGDTAVASSSMTVADAALRAVGIRLHATEGVTFAGVVATFNDSNSSAAARDFQATIYWGDGSTSSGTITAAKGGGFEVRGTHTYAEEGSHRVSVSVHDRGGSKAVVSAPVTVADAPLTPVGHNATGHAERRVHGSGCDLHRRRLRGDRR
jgi:hypothetical protein